MQKTETLDYFLIRQHPTPHWHTRSSACEETNETTKKLKKTDDAQTKNVSLDEKMKKATRTRPIKMFC
jgi:hypothetical protein